MLEHPYLATAVARLPVVDATGQQWCSTLATDGYAIYLNTEFTRTLRESHLIFAIAHELVHCILGHIDRREERDAFIWNIAADYATNELLAEYGFDVLDGALLSAKYRAWPVEKIYRDICEEHRKTVSRQAVRAAGPGSAHAVSASDQAIAEIIAQRADGRSRRLRRGRQRSVYGLDEHVGPDAAETAHFRPEQFPSGAERRRLRQELVGAAMAAGDKPGRWKSELARATTSPLAWQAVLAHFVSGLRRSDYRLYPPNRRHIYRGLYLPGLGVPGPQHLVVAVDTSGSMSTSLLSQVFSQIDHLREATECQVTLMQFDAVVQGEVRIDAWEPMDTRSLIGQSVVGRGGTDLCAPFRAIEESKDGRFQLIDALIIITDGLGPVPSKPPSFPVLWVLAPHGHNKCTFGAEVSLPPDE